MNEDENYFFLYFGYYGAKLLSHSQRKSLEIALDEFGASDIKIINCENQQCVSKNISFVVICFPPQKSKKYFIRDILAYLRTNEPVRTIIIIILVMPQQKSGLRLIGYLPHVHHSDIEIEQLHDRIHFLTIEALTAHKDSARKIEEERQKADNRIDAVTTDANRRIAEANHRIAEANHRANNAQEILRKHMEKDIDTLVNSFERNASLNKTIDIVNTINRRLDVQNEQQKKRILDLEAENKQYNDRVQQLEKQLADLKPKVIVKS